MMFSELLCFIISRKSRTIAVFVLRVLDLKLEADALFRSRESRWEGVERGTALLPEEVRSGRGACEGGADHV